jgi:hypothetical protein
MSMTASVPPTCTLPSTFWTCSRERICFGFIRKLFVMFQAHGCIRHIVREDLVYIGLGRELKPFAIKKAEVF